MTDDAVAEGSGNNERGKRARFFGCDPLPGVVFSLDTSRQRLPLYFLGRSKVCIDAASKANSTCSPLSKDMDDSSMSSALFVKPQDSDCAKESLETPCNDDVMEVCMPTNVEMITRSGKEDATAGTPDRPTLADSDNEAELLGYSSTETKIYGSGQRREGLLEPQLEHSPVTPATAKEEQENANLPEKTLEEQQHDAIHVDSVEACRRDKEAPRGSPLIPVPETQDPAAPTATTAAPDAVADEVKDGAIIERERQSQVPAPNKHGYPPIPKTNTMQEAPVNNNHDQQSLSASVMIASFLKQGMVRPVTTAPVSPSAALSPGERCRSNSDVGPAARSSLLPVRSMTTPTSPTPLASLLTGVPTGSGGGSSFGSPTALSANNITRGLRSPGGGSRFFNDEWSPRLKERRRVVRFPKRSDPPGTRILYWARGNYRVRDNMALSAAMWLSTQLRMPLQVVTFVDPAVGRAESSRPLPASRAQDRDHARGYAEQELHFRMAVEASALCEMEQSLRALNVPFVAIACPESEIPTALAKWCAAAGGSDTKMKTPLAGSVHLAVIDESYHPRQLRLTDRAREKLAGVALYTVDSSCVCPINTFRGVRVAGTAASAVGSARSRTTKAFSPEEFRKAQDDLLSIALAELVPRPRLPLDMLLQRSVLTGHGFKLPRTFECWLDDGSSLSPIAVIDWAKLRRLVTRCFPGFGKPTAEVRTASSTEDLIAAMGGGESVGEASLQQTLDIAAAHWPVRGQMASAGGQHCVGRVDKSIPGQMQSGHSSFPEGEEGKEERGVVGLGIAGEGVGFGGSLLHLLRLGSISSIRVVQELCDRAGKSGTGEVVGCNSENLKPTEGFANLLEAVLKREYALYRAFCYYQKVGRRHMDTGVGDQPSLPATHLQRPWRAADWMGIVPGWVWEELRKGQLDARQHPHSPAEIRSAGSTVPSSVPEDALFSAIQAHLTEKARLHPLLVSYWARSVVKMMLIPSQAMALVVEMADEFCLGARHAGDVITDLLSRAFEECPVSLLASDEASVTGSTELSSRELPIFRRLSDTPLATRAGLESALFEGGGWG